MLKPC